MRVVFIAFYEAYPPASGAASVTYNCVRHMPNECLLIQASRRAGSHMTPDGVRILSFSWGASRIGKMARLRRRVGEVTQMCRRLRPDVVVLEGASWALYHSLLLCELRRHVAASIVYHAHNVEYVLRSEKHGRMIGAVTRWAEARVVRDADLVFSVSPVDQRQFEELYGRRSEILPNGVDVERFADVSQASIGAVRAKYGLVGETVLFMGLYAYRPNTEAVDALVRNIFPAVRRRVPEARLVVIGGDIPYREPWLIAPGQIPYEELPAFVSACRLGIAPIYSGSGTRLKILEYLAAGLPVVSTRKGAEGLDFRDGDHLRLADSPHDVANATAELLANREAASLLGQAGRERVRSLYSWPAIMDGCSRTLRSRLLGRLASPRIAEGRRQ